MKNRKHDGFKPKSVRLYRQPSHANMGSRDPLFMYGLGRII